MGMLVMDFQNVFQPFTMITMGFSYMAFIMLGYFSFIPSFLSLHDLVFIGFMILGISLFHLSYLICWNTIILNILIIIFIFVEFAVICVISFLILVSSDFLLAKDLSIFSASLKHKL
jgi:hypothetical protein